MTTIYLKPDWDTPRLPPGITESSSAGHFVGRRDEVQRLANELVRGPQMSILFAGHRGVGKTTLVHEAGREAQRILRKTPRDIGDSPSPSGLVPVLLNANQLPTDL